MPDPISIAIVAEDDELSMAVAERIVDASGRSFVVSRRLVERGFGNIKRSIKKYRQASHVVPHLVLADLDRTECPALLRRQWYAEDLPGSMLFRVAVREIESWILGDCSGFTQFAAIATNEPTRRSQVSHIVVDSGWEKYVAEILEAYPAVAAWAKNDHLGFSIYYLWNGSKRKFIPDFLIRYASGKTLVLVVEVKGQDSAQDQAKRAALGQWVEAVNAHGGLGTWASDVVLEEVAGTMDAVVRHS